MYATCLYCQRNLGANHSIEQFPVGRRLAFDPARGRLWAVCPHCHRWNLAPLEERWEAIEQCERLFRGTRIRTSTDQIGLARLREGTELVRIGQPLRPEFAAWRYSDAIVRRRNRNLLIAGAGIVAASAVGLGAMAAGAGIGAMNLINLGGKAWRRRRDRRVVFRRGEASEPVAITAGDLDHVLLRLPAGSEPLSVEIELKGRGPRWSHAVREFVPSFAGGEITPITSLALARHNRTAGRPAHIRDAVDLLDRLGNPFADPDQARAWYGLWDRADRPSTWRGALALKTLAPPFRLALEMATHEERERLFLASHLSVLESAWKEAEQIARIADDLLLPEWIRVRVGGGESSGK